MLIRMTNKYAYFRPLHSTAFDGVDPSYSNRRAYNRIYIQHENGFKNFRHPVRGRKRLENPKSLPQASCANIIIYNIVQTTSSKIYARARVRKIRPVIGFTKIRAASRRYNNIILCSRVYVFTARVCKYVIFNYSDGMSSDRIRRTYDTARGRDGLPPTERATFNTILTSDPERQDVLFAAARPEII